MELDVDALQQMEEAAPEAGLFPHTWTCGNGITCTWTTVSPAVAGE
jgi:hypothetical protein